MRGSVRKREQGSVCTNRQLDPDLGADLSIVVILRKLLANFARRHADDRVAVGVIGEIASKDLGPDQPFLQSIGSAIERVFDDISQQRLTSIAGAKARTGEQPMQFLSH